MDCCQNIQDLGCIFSCDLIQIGELAPATGVYTIELQPSGLKITSSTNTAGTPLVFVNGLNEDMLSVFKIIKPNGSYFTSEDGYDCFKVDVKPSTNPTLSDTNIDPVACEDATVRNSDDSYSQSVASGGTLTLADQTINVNLDGVLVATTTVAAMQDNTTNIIWN